MPALYYHAGPENSKPAGAQPLRTGRGKVILGLADISICRIISSMLTPKRPKMFKRYKNLGGKSTVARYELAKDSITIIFADRSVYRYSNQSADPDNISKMKSLAVAGKGLGTFISANVKDRFSRKIK